MATPRLARSPTCLSCLRRLAQPQSPSQLFPSASFAFPSPLSWTQTRAKATKAELEDLQGIPVRLLRDIPTFGRQHAIIRVKPGRMRNIWFPKGAAEYMTKQRFTELGLTEAAIGVRDRSFGNKVLVDPQQNTQKQKRQQQKEDTKSKRMDALTLPAEETQALLTSLLPEVLVFPRIPVQSTPAPPPEPAVPRSPSLAANAATSTKKSTTTAMPEVAAAAAPTVTPIFGSVSRNDILALIKEKLLVDPQGTRVALEAESIELLGLDPEHDGENRIKRLGDFEILISPGVAANGKPLEPVRRQIQVIPEEP